VSKTFSLLPNCVYLCYQSKVKNFGGGEPFEEAGKYLEEGLQNEWTSQPNKAKICTDKFFKYQQK